MEHRKVFLNVLKVPDRQRGLDESKVESISASMDEIGLQQPISVCESKDKVTVQLVAGAHRVAAAKKLRWDKIDCIVVDLDDLDRQLWEIDENLCRADLTALERADHTKRRAELIRTSKPKAELNAKFAINSDQPKKRGPKDKGKGKIVADIVKKTGRSKRSVEADKARGTKIAPDVQEEIAGTDIADSGVQMDALTRATHDEQRETVKQVNLGQAKDVRDVLPKAQGKGNKKRRTKAEIRLDDFNHAMRAVSTICSALPKVKVPTLDSKQLSQSLADLRKAGKHIQEAIKTIQQTYDENQNPGE